MLGTALHVIRKQAAKLGQVSNTRTLNLHLAIVVLILIGFIVKYACLWASYWVISDPNKQNDIVYKGNIAGYVFINFALFITLYIFWTYAICVVEDKRKE